MKNIESSDSKSRTDSPATDPILLEIFEEANLTFKQLVEYIPEISNTLKEIAGLANEVVTLIKDTSGPGHDSLIKEIEKLELEMKNVKIFSPKDRREAEVEPSEPSEEQLAELWSKPIFSLTQKEIDSHPSLAEKLEEALRAKIPDFDSKVEIVKAIKPKSSSA